MTKNNDATRALKIFDESFIEYFGVGAGEERCTYEFSESEAETIRTELLKSAQVDNDVRIKVIKEMGFDYEATLNEDGSLRQHVITHEKHRGLFINHTSLICAMQRIPLVLRILTIAKERQKVDGLVKALQDCIKVMRDAEMLIDRSDLHNKWHTDNIPHGAFHDLLYKRIRGNEALQQFSATEI